MSLWHRASWSHAWKGRRIALTLFLLSGSVGLYVSTATSCINSDEFECGSRLETDGSRAKTCDRAGEYCVCDTNRCAYDDPACADEGGLRYSFGNRDCVSKAEAQSAFVQRPGGSKFCPGIGDAPPCGEKDGKVCASNEVCVCAQKRCATFDTVACLSGYRYTDADDCVEPIDARPDVILMNQDGGPGQLCPSESTPPLPCGVPGDASETSKCEGMQTCICAKNLFRCAKVSPGCLSGYAFFDGSCVRDLTADEINAPEQKLVDGLCPQYVPKDAGKD